MTGNRVLLDTSIIINSFKNNDVKRQLHGFSEIYVPVIAAGELYYGAYRSANIKKHLEQVYLFLQNYTLLSADIITSDLYGSIKTALNSKGKPIPENDIWIAAIAVQYHLPLFTADKHFKEIDNITLV